jgi:hypothetical protein
MRAHQRSFDVAVVFLVLTLAIAAAATQPRQAAIVSFDPPTDRVAGNQTSVLTVMYDGTDVGVGLAGYHLVIDFDDAYVFVNNLATDVVEGTLLEGVGETSFSATLEDSNTLVVDCSIIGETPGTFGIGDLCAITFTGRPTGDGVSPISFVESDLTDADGIPIACTATDGSIELDNTPPDVPTLAPEPEFTYGTENTVYWSDESASGAVGYCCECSEYPDFTPIYMSSGCTPDLQFTYTPLAYDQIYYYRVKCRDDLENTSGWSESVFSTQLEPAADAEGTTWGVIKGLFR